MTRWLVVLVVAWTLHAHAASEQQLLDGLATDDPAQLRDAIAAIERAPTTPELADVLFAAGRACEDRLHDPARAFAIYERIVRELPDAGLSIAAGRRLEQLAGVRDHAREAAELATLTAEADALPRDEVARRAEALVAASWPGAADAALWFADWSCRTQQFAPAQQRYATIATRWPGSDQARLARRNAASCAIDAQDWPLAKQLASALPHGEDADRAIREDLLGAADRGAFRARLYTLSWLGLAVAFVLLLGSLGDAMLRGGLRRPALRPPVEVVFLAPVAAVVAAAALTAHRAAAPAVMWISIGGLALAWLSGAALDLLRGRQRSVRARAAAHVLVVVLGVVAVGYIAVTRDGLIDSLAETVKFGPGA
jgi:hypothetical protein